MSIEPETLNRLSAEYASVVAERDAAIEALHAIQMSWIEKEMQLIAARAEIKGRNDHV